MRHYRDIVQACPGGGPVIPNQSLAVQRLERKIRTQESRFFFLFFFQWMLNSKTVFPLIPSASFTSAFILFNSYLPSYYIDHFYVVYRASWWLYTPLCHADIFRCKCSWHQHIHQRKYDLFLLLCWAICNILQMNTDLFKSINSFIWPKLRSSTEENDPLRYIKHRSYEHWHI